MKLIIDIPEEAIKTTNIANDTIAYLECCTPRLLDMLRNGTPLPKGHGNIVDIETLIDMFWDGNSMEITKYDLSVIEPIIKADRAESEE